MRTKCCSETRVHVWLSLPDCKSAGKEAEDMILEGQLGLPLQCCPSIPGPATL